MTDSPIHAAVAALGDLGEIRRPTFRRLVEMLETWRTSPTRFRWPGADAATLEAINARSLVRWTRQATMKPLATVTDAEALATWFAAFVAEHGPPPHGLAMLAHALRGLDDLRDEAQSRQRRGGLERRTTLEAVARIDAASLALTRLGFRVLALDPKAMMAEPSDGTLTAGGRAMLDWADVAGHVAECFAAPQREAAGGRVAVSG